MKGLPSWSLMSGVVVVALVAGGAIGMVLGRAPLPASVASSTSAPAAKPLQAMTAAEENYAAALWPIHSEVKLAAIRATFAGIKYKTGDDDLERLHATVGEVAKAFDHAQANAAALAVPPSIASVHQRYLEAVGLYRAAAETVLTADAAAIDARLLAAQDLSFRASEGTLVVGDVLWPAEHKPH